MRNAMRNLGRMYKELQNVPKSVNLPHLIDQSELNYFDAENEPK